MQNEKVFTNSLLFFVLKDGLPIDYSKGEESYTIDDFTKDKDEIIRFFREWFDSVDDSPEELLTQKEKENQAPPGSQAPAKQQSPLKQQAPPELIDKLKDRDSSVRRNAAATIGDTGDEKAVDSLIAVLKDDNRFVRQEVVRALGKIGDAMALESLTQALVEEKDEFVQGSIKKAIERLQPK